MQIEQKNYLCVVQCTNVIIIAEQSLFFLIVFNLLFQYQILKIINYFATLDKKCTSFFVF